MRKNFHDEVAGLPIKERASVEDALWRPAVVIKNKEDSIEDIEIEDKPLLRPTAKVVAIVNSNKKKDFAGLISVPSQVKLGFPVPSTLSYVLFKPIDSKCPYIRLPFGVLPSDFLADPHSKASTLYSVRMSKWDTYNRQPEGVLRCSLGECGEIAAETLALLEEFGVNHGDFSDEVLNCLKSYDDTWKIPSKEIELRGVKGDMRHYRIFSIDPTTARDLDDALHIRKLPNGNYEIGVHIAGENNHFYYQYNS